MSDSDERNGREVGDGADAVEATGESDDGPLGGGVGENGVEGNGVVESAHDARHEFLREAVRRGPLLRALRDGPASASELSRSVETSRSTVHRATNSLSDRELIAKTDGQYELTGLGRIVAEESAAFGESVWTAVTLEPFLNTADVDGIPIEHFVDATVTRPTPRRPHTSIQRIIELIEEAESLRMLSTVLSPIYVNVGYHEMMAGMEIEAVFDREAIEIMVTEHAERARETIETGNFDVYSHDALPFELFLLEDGIGMAAHDESGVARILVECEAPEAIEWAEGVYDDHRSEAEPLLLPEL